MKRVLKTALSLMLVAVLAMSMFACTKAEKKDADETIFENQHKFDRYAFAQGYADEWTFYTGDDGYGLLELENPNADHDGYLVAKFTPKDNQDMQYTIYWYDTKSPMYTDELVMNNLMADEVDGANDITFLFNEIFIEEAPRETYVLTSEQYEKKEYSHNDCWGKASYTFVKDGDNWKGDVYAVLSSEACRYFIITCEAKEEKWTDADKIFQDMLEDFSYTTLDNTAGK